ncbi:type I DNA topoisomerase [Propionibacterium freudenreichii]|uniref:type I DNA topoisomerase n=1 Tax=Propionibacterium freudenreichii TaxID=1744 RepID=UPI000BC32500|nr:type I DNA topoisomerase [Propionibacterium freudenreichii]MDK9295570.1 type I DNA topoisomerase [Propionibacterium freudenreichii]MDK9360946.1 type I DNA topoisomerase [Propionibacterium freudenreichii]MDK9639825.1 type I DNA topoisomerase [Propionibacterium freudenreichii]MDK9660960.1 type I DNA topoisomerase [Propionibacterium freudenreichii]WGU90103.1 type I DNA topoisomerase [Propionibacterium freudenreichii]
MATTPRRLVIVESPTKATKIAGYLGPGYVVESSRGHVRDLPTSAAEVPAKYKGQSWARTGVNVDDDFAPIYVVSADKKSTIKQLKAELKNADELYLATDGDREGEAIAWHLLQELKPKIPVKRMVFHEITPAAIQEAVKHPRTLDEDLVEAQETRRILDRLYGYEVSPVLWKKVMPRLSAGRVQSVATRLIVDRERDRMAFRAASYWDIEAILDAGASATPRQFPARLVSLDGQRIAQGSSFDSLGHAKSDVAVLDKPATDALSSALATAPFVVTAVEAKPYTRRPAAPFRTTTLQQEAGRKLGFTTDRTMRVAQELYEDGYITYMRTDSVTLSGQAITAARDAITQLYGADYVPERPRIYNSKVKNAQEAHEAIRPSGEHFRTPAQTGLRGDQFKLYELVWQRTVASQMADATGQQMTVRIEATPTQRVALEGVTPQPVRTAQFTASGRTITFQGFLKAYVESSDKPEQAQARLPQLAAEQKLDAAAINPEGHETKPPARFTEPSLVAKLEELDIGRPSTYASIIRTITSRDYVFKRGSALVPTWLAFAVTRLLEEHFSELVDYDFTAALEDHLDEIAKGDADRLAVLQSFYFGNNNADTHEGLHKLTNSLGDIDARALSTFHLGDLDSGIDVRVGRYGTYVQDEEEHRANVPEDMAPDELTVEAARELLAHTGGDERELGLDPTTHLAIVVKAGRFGPYVTEVLPDDDDAPAAKKSKVKPRTASLFRTMDPATVTLDDALKLLSLPRVVGGEGEEQVTAQNGRYGPYLKKGSDTRSLPSEESIFTTTMEQAAELFAQPKRRGRQAAAPLRELGEDPNSGKPVVVKDGRFGPYVTDGEYNATLRKADSVEAITLDRAAELLAEKRAKGPAPKKRTTRKATAKKAAAAKKPAAKKLAAKKPAAKKTASTAKPAAKKPAAKKSASTSTN